MRTHVPRPTWSARRTSGHGEIPADAVAQIDRVLTFHGLDPQSVQTDFIDTCRRRDLCRLSWVTGRSDYPAAQTWAHERVRFALDDLVIRTGKTVVIESPFGDPVELIVYRLAIESGGVLRVEAPLSLTVGELLGLPANAVDRDAQPPCIEYVARSGEDGLNGSPGVPGANGDDAFPCGHTGGDGAPGLTGTAGQALPDQKVFIHTVSGITELHAGAGIGGRGGNGGSGGPGGNGRSIAFFNMAAGATGGQGGKGGNGGDGGDGGDFRLGIRRYAPDSRLILSLRQACGGQAGLGGTPGRGGIGVPDGAPGLAGAPGNNGRDGRAINLIWTEKGESVDA